jgi:biotin carboxylase
MSATTILAITSYFKGEEFLRACKREGAHVMLLTEEKLRDDPWPRESIDEVFLMPDLTKISDVVNGVAYLARGRKIDRILPLDEYDVENVAILREHLRVPGMGISLTKRFRDKLIMRQAAHEAGIRVPAFTPVIHYDDLRAYMKRVPPPWVLKPRLEAGAMGIRRVFSEEELWRLLDQLGDEGSFRVLEQYIPGAVYHVDAITYHGETCFASVQRYGQPPLNVSHDGGIFTTLTLDPAGDEAAALCAFNVEVIRALGLHDGVTHAEFIKGDADGQFYFLEIAARVGGANIADLVEAATGVNPWAEWARLEIAQARGEPYTLPKTFQRYGGLLVSLAKQDYPDLSGYNDPEVAWRMHKKHHAGLIVASDDPARVESLVNHYAERFLADFNAVVPARDKPEH